MNTMCDTETCSSCHAETVDTDQNGECRSCATLSHNLRLMTAGVGRDRKTGRYMKVGKK